MIAPVHLITKYYFYIKSSLTCDVRLQYYLNLRIALCGSMLLTEKPGLIVQNVILAIFGKASYSKLKCRIEKG